jgi:hypothetical protein
MEAYRRILPSDTRPTARGKPSGSIPADYGRLSESIHHFFECAVQHVPTLEWQASGWSPRSQYFD